MSAMKHIVVAGNGLTTETNVEALLTDFYYANGADYLLVLPFQQGPTQGQIWAHRISETFNVNTVVVAPDNVFMGTISKSSLVSPEAGQDIYGTTASMLDQDSQAFLLWSPDDLEVSRLRMTLETNGVRMYDLCMGLLPLEEGGTAITDVTTQTPEETPLETAPEPVLEPRVDSAPAPMDMDELGKKIYKAVMEVLANELKS